MCVWVLGARIFGIRISWYICFCVRMIGTTITIELSKSTENVQAFGIARTHTWTQFAWLMNMKSPRKRNLYDVFDTRMNGKK